MTYTANQQALLAHYVKKILAAPVYELAVRPPLQPAPALSEALGNQILLKREDLQPTFSFKIRGAYNKLVQLSDEQKARGVITASAGNHAQGVALAARELGIAATIVMPATTPELKVLGVRSRGAEAVLHGESFPFALAYALDLAARTGRTFVSPFDDPEVIAGQGTVAMEILRQPPAGLDAIFVPVGGGGLVHWPWPVSKSMSPAPEPVARPWWPSTRAPTSTSTACATWLNVPPHAARRPETGHIAAFLPPCPVRATGRGRIAFCSGSGAASCSLHDRWRTHLR